MDKMKASYIPAFDGIRALSILLVSISHLGFEHIIPGGLGVTIFFFISGFLITRLLIEEFDKSNTIGLKNFFIRRLIRLYPPLIFFLIVMSALILIIESNINLKELAAAIFYYENYYVVFSNHEVIRFKILWSLAVEEHFYLFFPLLFLFLFPKRKFLLVVIIALAVISFLLRLSIALRYEANNYSEISTYSLTHLRADSIMYGCLLSMILYADKRQQFLKFSSHIAVFIVSAGLLLFTLLLRDEFFRQTFRYSLQGIALLFLIPPILYHPKYISLRNFLSVKPLLLIGKLSYSIYFSHWVALYIALRYFTKGGVEWYVGYIIITFAVAYISFNWVEKPMATLRKKYGSVIK